MIVSGSKVSGTLKDFTRCKEKLLSRVPARNDFSGHPKLMRGKTYRLQRVIKVIKAYAIRTKSRHCFHGSAYRFDCLMRQSANDVKVHSVGKKRADVGCQQPLREE